MFQVQPSSLTVPPLPLRWCSPFLSYSTVDTFPTIGYEFPNGFNFELGHERFQIPEALFDPSILLVRRYSPPPPLPHTICAQTLTPSLSLLQESGGSSMLSMSHIVASSISLCDIDIRPVGFDSPLPHSEMVNQSLHFLLV